MVAYQNISEVDDQVNFVTYNNVPISFTKEELKNLTADYVA